MSPQQLSTLPGLHEEDFKVFGTLIQHFCFIDLNFRRLIEVFANAKMLPEDVTKRYRKLRDFELADVVIEIVKNMDATTEDIPTTLAFLEGISKARMNRNLVGHFAGKRFPDKDVYVFASKSDRDARKAGLSLQVGHVHMAVVVRSEFWAMTDTVGQAQLWLASKYGEWEERYTSEGEAS
jgi:hypothetical protein